MRLVFLALACLAVSVVLTLAPFVSGGEAGPLQENADGGGDIRSPWQDGIWQGSGPEMRAYICRYAKQRPAWCDEIDREPNVHPLVEPEVYGPDFTVEDARWHRLLRDADPHSFTPSDIELIRKRAGETGDPAAMEIMGYLYARGIGVPRDPEIAYIWYGQAFIEGETSVKANMDILWDEMALRDDAAVQRVISYFDSYRPAAELPARTR